MEYENEGIFAGAMEGVKKAAEAAKNNKKAFMENENEGVFDGAIQGAKKAADAAAAAKNKKSFAEGVNKKIKRKGKKNNKGF